MSSIWNNRISVSVFGEAQAPAIGITIDNLPPGEYINTEELASFMSRRGSRTMRDGYENPLPHIMSGVVNERTTGMPLCAFLQNTPEPPSIDENAPVLMRTGHADYTGAARYKGFCDVRASVGFTDRITLPLCFAGAICGQILQRRGIYAGAHILSIHNTKDNPFDPVNVGRDSVLSVRNKDFPVINDHRGWTMAENIRKAAEAGESLGGIIECVAVNVPAGIGSPVFDGLENSIAQLIFGIPGVSGLEFGAGFSSAKMTGSQNNDDYYVNDHGYVLTKTNHHGGVLSGISSGMPVVLRVAVKPPMPKNGISGNEMKLSDACSVPGLVPCVEAAVNIALLSHMIDYPDFC